MYDMDGNKLEGIINGGVKIVIMFCHKGKIFLK